MSTNSPNINPARPEVIHNFSMGQSAQLHYSPALTTKAFNGVVRLNDDGYMTEDAGARKRIKDLEDKVFDLTLKLDALITMHAVGTGVEKQENGLYAHSDPFSADIIGKE